MQDTRGLFGALAGDGRPLLKMTGGALIFSGACRSLWQAIAIAGCAGFGCAIGVHLLVGYVDPSHLMPALVGALLFLIGLAFSYRPDVMRVPRTSVAPGNSMRRTRLFVIAFLNFTAAAQAQTAISWSTTANNFRQQMGQPITLVCPNGGWPNKVWGTDTYTDDSSICTAAVHAGVISFADGGTILLQMRPGQTSYRGSQRNGVTSDRWESWDASFSVAEAPRAPAPQKPGAAQIPSAISWQRNARGLAPNGRRFTFVCRTPARPARVMGGDLYSWDSSICNAAVHAGAITRGRGGVVTIEMRPGAMSYRGSERNGVTSTEGTRTSLGFVVIPPRSRAR
jgi:LCCL domain-containing protein